jgi:hypothetical protein
MVVPGRVEVVSHKTRPLGICQRTTCSLFLVSNQLPEFCSLLLQETAVGWSPAPWRKPGLGMCWLQRRVPLGSRSRAEAWRPGESPDWEVRARKDVAGTARQWKSQVGWRW